jgi:hypothetical protein
MDLLMIKYGLINTNHSINGGFAAALFFLFGKLLLAYGMHCSLYR